MRNRARISPWLLALGAFALVLAVMAIVRALGQDSDFAGFYAAGARFRAQGAIAYQARRYPPTFLVFMLPFSMLPRGLAAMLWVGLNLAALALLPGLLTRLTGVSLAQQRWPWLVVLPFVVDNILLGQPAPILMWAVTAGLVNLRTAGSALGASAIGGAALIKLLPACYLAIPALFGRLRAAVLGTLLAGAVGAALLVATAGPERAVTMIDQWLSELRTRQTVQALASEPGGLRPNNQGLGVVLLRTWTRVRVTPEPEGIVRLGALPARGVRALLFTLLGVLIAVWAGCGWRLRRASPGAAWAGMFALTSILMLALSPLVWTHYFIWLLPALVFLADWPRLQVAAAIVSFVGLLPAARSLGCHMALGVALFGVVASVLWRLPGFPQPAVTALRSPTRAQVSQELQ